MSEETETAVARVEAMAAEYGLTMRAEFVPFSRSRNAKPNAFSGDGKPFQSLNWRLTLERDGRTFLEADYSQGVGHCPANKARAFKGARHLLQRAIELEIETGKVAEMRTWQQEPKPTPRAIPAPSIVDVLGSLALDASAIDHPNFESWAEEYGYSEDSRTAEATYRACVETGLSLRAAIGEDGLAALREAAAEL